MTDPVDLPIRPRRLRQPLLRRALQRVALRRSDVIIPVFVREGANVRQEVPSMPGVFQMSVDIALPWLTQRAEEGFGAYLVFGVIDRARKDPLGSAALDENNVVCRLLRDAKAKQLPMVGVTDLCFCEYTSHGHCGPLTDDNAMVKNDETVQRLVLQAVNHAKAGAGVIAPSGMMDGTVAALRRGLDAAGFVDTSILSYAVKYASAFYGPFRDAADSAPSFGDRRTAQMDPGNVDEALREVRLDIAEGADMVMVKPALAYLDVVRRVKDETGWPVCAYHVSGEYAMIEAAAERGWIDGPRAHEEALTAIRRAGADLVVSYWARQFARARR